MNNFNASFFLNKTLFLENIIAFILTEKLLLVFFVKKSLMSDEQKDELKKKLTKNIVTSKKYNFCKLWFVKYNNFILLSIFSFFYLKIRKKKEEKKKFVFTKKSAIVFFKKRKGRNVKRFLFLNKNYMVF